MSSKLSALTSASALSFVDSIYIVQGGISKKATLTQVQVLLGGGSYVARTSMAAISSPAVGTVVQLGESGREGLFVVDLASNWTAAITADTLQGIFVISTTDATKVYRRVFTGPMNVKWFGALGNGVTDDRAAIAAAVITARGGRLLFPKGNYVINTNGGTITLEEVTLIGEEVLDGATATIDQGSNLWITGTTNSPFNVRRGSSVKSLGFYYPNQADSAAPTVYPTTLTFDFTNGAVQFVTISGCVVYNAYRFVDIDNGSSGGVGHVSITDNFVCALNRGVYLRYNSEHIRVERNNFTFGFWLAATEAGARGYMRANAIALQVDQSDGIEFWDNLVFGHLTGLLASATALCQFMNIAGNKFDQVRYGVKATGAGNFVGEITDNTFNSFNNLDHTLQGRSISVETTGAGVEVITIEGNEFAQATEDHVYTSGNTATRKIVVGPNNYLSWAAYKAAGAYGAINANGALTNVQVTGGWFYGSNSSAFSNGVMGSANTLEVSVATFEGCLAPINFSTNVATLIGNRSYNTGGATSNVLSATSIQQSGNAWDKPATVMQTISAGTYSVGPTDVAISFTAACTVTLPSAATNSGREIRLRTTGANAITSASSNVVPLTGGAAGTAILAATAGKWASLLSDGTSWQIMGAN